MKKMNQFRMFVAEKSNTIISWVSSPAVEVDPKYNDWVKDMNDLGLQVREVTNRLEKLVITLESIPAELYAQDVYLESVFTAALDDAVEILKGQK